jgi:hypothetical protein
MDLFQTSGDGADVFPTFVPYDSRNASPVHESTDTAVSYFSIERGIRDGSTLSDTYADVEAEAEAEAEEEEEEEEAEEKADDIFKYSKVKIKGIRNEQNACYVISSIQLLMSIPAFANQDMHITNGYKRGQIQTDDLYTFLTSTAFSHTVRDDHKLRTQQDAEEVIRYIADRYPDQVFMLNRKSTTCRLRFDSSEVTYSYPRDRPETVLAIYPKTRQETTLERLIDEVQYPQISVAAVERMNVLEAVCTYDWFEQAPEYLIGCINRRDSLTTKNDVDITFTLHFNVSGVTYEIIAFSIHKGGAAGGHYISFAKTADERWKEMNDNTVSSAPNVDKQFLKVVNFVAKRVSTQSVTNFSRIVSSNFGIDQIDNLQTWLQRICEYVKNVAYVHSTSSFDYPTASSLADFYTSAFHQQIIDKSDKSGHIRQLYQMTTRLYTARATKETYNYLSSLPYNKLINSREYTNPDDITSETIERIDRRVQRRLRSERGKNPDDTFEGLQELSVKSGPYLLELLDIYRFGDLRTSTDLYDLVGGYSDDDRCDFLDDFVFEQATGPSITIPVTLGVVHDFWYKAKGRAIPKCIRPVLARRGDRHEVAFLWKGYSALLDMGKPLPLLCPWWASAGLYIPELCSTLSRMSVYSKKETSRTTEIRTTIFDAFVMYNVPERISQLPSFRRIAISRENMNSVSDDVFNNKRMAKTHMRKECRTMPPLPHPSFLFVRDKIFCIKTFILSKYEKTKVNVGREKKKALRIVAYFVTKCSYDVRDALTNSMRMAIERRKHDIHPVVSFFNVTRMNEKSISDIPGYKNHKNVANLTGFECKILFTTDKEINDARMPHTMMKHESYVGVIERVVQSLCIDVVTQFEMFDTNGRVRCAIDVVWEKENTAFNTFSLHSTPRTTHSSVKSIAPTTDLLSARSYALMRNANMSVKDDQIQVDDTGTAFDPSAWKGFYSRGVSSHISHSTGHLLSGVDIDFGLISRAASNCILCTLHEKYQKSAAFITYSGDTYVLKDKRSGTDMSFVLQFASYVFWFLYADCFGDNDMKTIGATKGNINPYVCGAPMRASHYAWAEQDSRAEKRVALLYPSIVELRTVCEDAIKCMFSIGKFVNYSEKRVRFVNNVEGVWNNCYAETHVSSADACFIRPSRSMYVETFPATLIPPYGVAFKLCEKRKSKTTEE